MAINKVNTTAEEKSFNFLTNQSTILRTVDTNNITINGVNVIVDKPKRGDIMCITKYKNDSGTLLDADKQKVIWIDGLSINPDYLSEEYEPVGICIVVKGNKALVKYREERSFRWSAGERWELPESSIMNDGANHKFKLALDGINIIDYNYLVLTSADTTSRKAFVDKLNTWFLTNYTNCSAELVELDTDLPATDTSDIKDRDSYRNRVIVNVRGTKIFTMTDVNDGTKITPTRAIGKQIEAVNWYYINNGFTRNFEGVCCRAKYYDYIQENQRVPTKPMTNINIVTGGFYYGKISARKEDFENHKYCQILRDNFANYDEYLESMLVKVPCGAGGTITEFTCGKENTYKLADCTFLDNATGEQSPLYLAANWAASISLNAPKLGKGNWWLPSAAEITEIMRDITYGTSFWEANPDIINRVLAKLTSISNSGWSMLSASTKRWTSSRYDKGLTYLYDDSLGILNYDIFYYDYMVAPITIYEF